MLVNSVGYCMGEQAMLGAGLHWQDLRVGSVVPVRLALHWSVADGLPPLLVEYPVLEAQWSHRPLPYECPVMTSAVFREVGLK